MCRRISSAKRAEQQAIETVLVFVALIAVCYLVSRGYGHAEDAIVPAHEVYFAPGDEPSKVACQHIDGSKRDLDIEAYYFTDDSIADAIGRAIKRGVAVRVLVDAKTAESKGSDVQLLRSKGATVRTDGEHPIFHNKIMIVDRRMVLTGSYNWTQAAHSNAENLLVLRSEDLARRYREEFAKHWSHAK